MKTSEAFRRAKQCLHPNGQEGFICHALYEAAYDSRAGSAGTNWQVIYDTKKSGYKTAIKVITDRMGDTNSLETWLRQNHGIETWMYEAAQMQAYRHRWLDALIAEFEAKGD